MILQRLAEHYDRIAASDNNEAQLAPPGFSLQRISFCVVLELDGRLNSFQSLQQQDGKRLVAKSMIVPGQGKPPGQGISPCFLWDNASYLLGWRPDPDPDKTARAVLSFEAFRSKHLELENRIAHPSFTAVCSFLRSWSPEQAIDHAFFAANEGNLPVIQSILRHAKPTTTALYLHRVNAAQLNAQAKFLEAINITTAAE